LSPAAWIAALSDLIANASVLLAALAVWVLDSPWPDVLVGALICAMFLRSAIAVAREARHELNLAHS